MRRSICKILLMVISLLFFAGSCRNEKSASGLKDVEPTIDHCNELAAIADRQGEKLEDFHIRVVNATIDDLQGKKVEAILIMNTDDPNKAHFMVIIGNIRKVQEIVGYDITADKIVDSSWVQRLTSDFIKAERVKRLYWDNYRAIFLTKKRAYMIKVSFDKDNQEVYGPDYNSKQVWYDFEEMDPWKHVKYSPMPEQFKMPD